MSRTDRHLKRRALGFENLEGKTSPTNLLGFGAVDGVEVAVVSDSARSADRFRMYVSAMEDVSIERSLPSQSEADAVDQWISSHLPPAGN